MTQQRDPLEVLAELRQALRTAGADVVQKVRPALSELIRQVDRQYGASFVPGQFVEFNGRGVLLVAEIEKVNVKTLSVVVRTPASHDGHRWKVSPSLVKVTPRPANLPAAGPFGKEQAVAQATSAFADDPDAVATYLTERDGQHLVFVETSAHGYYLVVKKSARPRVVGEEDCGIESPSVRAFFNIDQYASRCFAEQGKPLMF